MERISAEVLSLPDINNDSCSTITDTTDVLLQAKPYFPSTTKANMLKIGNYRPGHHKKKIKPTEIKDSQRNAFSNSNSLNDPNTDKDSSTCNADVLLRNEMTIKLQQLQERNKVLRHLLYSKSTRYNKNPFQTIENGPGDSMDSMASILVKPDIQDKDANVLTSTFANSPNIFLASLSSIRSTESTDPLHGSILEFLNNTKSKCPTSGVENLTENIENAEHKLYLDKLLKDIEDSSSSILTTPLFDARSMSEHRQESTRMKHLLGKFTRE